MTSDPSRARAARELLRRRVESLVGPAGVRWSVIATLTLDQITLVLADAALLECLSVLSQTWEQPPAECFEAAVAALDLDLRVVEGTAAQITVLLAEPEPVSALDTALDAVVAGASAEWALVHAKASRGNR